MSALHPETRPQDCWDWLTPEEVARMALIAYEMARKHSRPPAGERFRDVGGVWASREDFARNLAYLFELQVKSEAHGLGIGDYADEAGRLLLWRGKAGRDPQRSVATTCTEALQ